MIPHSSPCIGDAEVEAVGRVLRSGRLAQGREVEAFESECAELLNRRHAVAVSSGTAGLHLALAVLNGGPNMLVAVPAYTCASILTAIYMQGVHAHLCDVGSDFTMKSDEVSAEASVAIVPHLFGAAARLPETDHVIEDIAQSFGGPTGRGPHTAIASFYATKLMTTGEGGMIFTDDEPYAEALRDLRDYDNRDDFRPRFSYKMTDFQAAMGRVQLKRLPEFIRIRREIALRYLDAFRDLPAGLPHPDNHVFFRFVVTTPNRDALAAHLHACGIEAKKPVHQSTHLYFHDGRQNGHVKLLRAYPGADRAEREALSIPLHPSMVERDISHVIDSVTQFL